MILPKFIKIVQNKKWKNVKNKDCRYFAVLFFYHRHQSIESRGSSCQCLTQDLRRRLLWLVLMLSSAAHIILRVNPVRRMLTLKLKSCGHVSASVTYRHHESSSSWQRAPADRTRSLAIWHCDLRLFISWQNSTLNPLNPCLYDSRPNDLTMMHRSHRCFRQRSHQLAYSPHVLSASQTAG